MYKDFYAKVLLVGEYTLLIGSSGLTIPLKTFSGRLSKIFPGSSNDHYKSNQQLNDFLNYLLKNEKSARILDIESLQKDISDGLFFDSNIPLNYGVGSSGSVVAALYEHYKISDFKDLKNIRKELAFLESYFHGKSSGIDPLSIYIGKPLLIRKENQLQIIESTNIKLKDGHLYLFDSDKVSGTRDLVKDFMLKLKQPEYNEKILTKLLPATERFVSAILNVDSAGLYKSFRSISMLQFQLFSKMIPEGVLEIWETGLTSGKYFVKLCGSGGGGFVLLYTRSRQLNNNELSAFNIIKIL